MKQDVLVFSLILEVCKLILTLFSIFTHYFIFLGNENKNMMGNVYVNSSFYGFYSEIIDLKINWCYFIILYQFTNLFYN